MPTKNNNENSKFENAFKAESFLNIASVILGGNNFRFGFMDEDIQDVGQEPIEEAEFEDVTYTTASTSAICEELTDQKLREVAEQIKKLQEEFEKSLMAFFEAQGAGENAVLLLPLSYEHSMPKHPRVIVHKFIEKPTIVDKKVLKFFPEPKTTIVIPKEDTINDDLYSSEMKWRQP